MVGVYGGRLYSTVYEVQKLYLTPEGELVLTMYPSVPAGFTLKVVTKREIERSGRVGEPNDTVIVETERKFTIGPAFRPQARWTITGLRGPWSWDVTLGMDRPRAALAAIYVHYDEGSAGVNGFRKWQPAQPASYGLRALLPKVFSYYDQDGVKFGRTTHAKLKVVPQYQGVTLRVRQQTYDSQGRNPTLGPWRTVTAGQLSHAIELSRHSPNNYVYIEVTDGSVVHTHFLNIDPRARRQFVRRPPPG